MSTVVKIQQSIVTNAGKAQVLIYNQSRTIQYEGDLPEDVEKFMAGKMKIFALVNIKDDKINVIRAVKPRNW